MEYEDPYSTNNSLRMNSTLTRMVSVQIHLSWHPFKYYTRIFIYSWAFQVVSVLLFSEHVLYIISLCSYMLHAKPIAAAPVLWA
jgi:hypothetical protein